jgi:hypothetical protein
MNPGPRRAAHPTHLDRCAQLWRSLLGQNAVKGPWPEVLRGGRETAVRGQSGGVCGSQGVLAVRARTYAAADAGLMMPLTRSIMIFTKAPRLLYMVCAPSRLHFVSEPG